MRRVKKTQADKDAKKRKSEGEASSNDEENGPHQQARASASKHGTSGRRAGTPRRGRRTERVVETQRASVRRVDKTPMDEDAEDERSESGACSPGGEEGPHQRTRTSAGERNTRGRRARTPRRGQGTARVDEAQGLALRRVNEMPEDSDRAGGQG